MGAFCLEAGAGAAAGGAATACAAAAGVVDWEPSAGEGASGISEEDEESDGEEADREGAGAIESAANTAGRAAKARTRSDAAGSIDLRIAVRVWLQSDCWSGFGSRVKNVPSMLEVSDIDNLCVRQPGARQARF